MMKALVFVLMTVASCVSFATERVFDCKATHLDKSAGEISDTHIATNPQVLFRQGLGKFSLQVGDLEMSTENTKGPALKVESAVAGDAVQYNFWVDGSYEYEFFVSVLDHSADLFWWGTGEPVFVGQFQCEVTEQ